MTVCVSCGCALPHDDHHDPRHITVEDLQAAADAADTTVGTVAHNIESYAMHHDDAATKSDGGTATGAVLKADPEQRFVLMVLYSPNRMPHRGADRKIDVVSPSVLEKACWRFTDNGLKVGLFHEAGHQGAARCVENYVYRNPVPWVIKSPDGNTQVIKEGDWIGGFILDPPTWDMYKSGLIGGASPQGTAGRKPASPETLARINGEAA